jgi:hypothetical protein
MTPSNRALTQRIVTRNARDIVYTGLSDANTSRDALILGRFALQNEHRI